MIIINRDGTQQTQHGSKAVLCIVVAVLLGWYFFDLVALLTGVALWLL